MKPPGAIKIRDYQTEAADSVFAAWLEVSATVMVLPTGMGKTVVAAEIIHRWPGPNRILFVAHIQELIYQAKKTIAFHTDEHPAIEMGVHSDDVMGHPVLDRSKVLVASIQTMSKRMTKFDPKNFDAIIIDEFHHAAAATYRKLWDFFRAGNPEIKLLGITATADRTDNLTIGCVADNCCFERGIREGIDDGWLVPIEQKYIVVKGLDFSKCRTVAKDLNEKDLANVMMGGDEQEKQEKMLHAVAAPAIEAAAGKPGLVFCVTVAHAERLAEVMRRYNVTAEVVHGKTDYERRKEIVESFKAGKIQWLVGVGCFTEGFDAPNVSVIVMARPTKSRMLYTQMVGRGTRPLPGLVDPLETPEERTAAIAQSDKPAMIVLDFVGNSGKHKLISTADILAGDMPESYVEAAVDEMRETGRAADVRKLAWEKKQEHDREAKKRAAEEAERKEAARKEAQARAEAKRARIKAEADWHAKEIDPFGTHDTAPEQVQSKYRGGASDKTIRLCVRLGIDEATASRWSQPQAGAVIERLKAQHGSKFIMRFGKYMGRELHTIPADYLKWMADGMRDAQVQSELETYRKEIRAGKADLPPKKEQPK